MFPGRKWEGGGTTDHGKEGVNRGGGVPKEVGHDERREQAERKIQKRVRGQGAPGGGGKLIKGTSANTEVRASGFLT